MSSSVVTIEQCAKLVTKDTDGKCSGGDGHFNFSPTADCDCCTTSDAITTTTQAGSYNIYQVELPYSLIVTGEYCEKFKEL